MRKFGLIAAGMLGVAACVFLVMVGVSQDVDRAGVWAAVLGLPTGLVGAGAAVWAVAVPKQVPVPGVSKVPDWVVERPGELASATSALTARRGGTVEGAIALNGAAGFGKTTLALMVCADRRIVRRFRSRVYWVTVGRDARGAAAIAAKVNDLIKLITGEDATFTDPRLAGQRLGAVLSAGPRRLLVLDDVWEASQLAPFMEGSQHCSRLVTTRNPSLLAGLCTAVQVDQMLPEQAQMLLTAGLPPLDHVLTTQLLMATGKWPLLLRLVNKILANAVDSGADLSLACSQLLERLQVGGPAVVEDLLGDVGLGPNIAEPEQRARAVRATIGASTGLLSSEDARRFAELGIFAADETIPFELACLLWRATARLEDLQAAQICSRLAELALVTTTGARTGGLALHDVVRDFIRIELGHQELALLNNLLLEAIAADLPTISPPGNEAIGPLPVAWWKMKSCPRYMLHHLIQHMLDAGKPSEAASVACDLRWAGTQLQQFGPAALAADLSLVGGSQAERLRELVDRTAHLLTPTEPATALLDILHSRVAADPDWGPQARALRDFYPKPRLVNRWTPPDLPDPSVRRALAGHTDWVDAVAIAPDGRWLASSGRDNTIRIWDTATGRPQACLTGHQDRVIAVAIAPEGRWLASASRDGQIRIWDPVSAREITRFACHRDSATAIAIAPDSKWLATVTPSRFPFRRSVIQIWDAATGRERYRVKGGLVDPKAVAIAPDGTWLAACDSWVLRVWDVPKRRRWVKPIGNGNWLDLAIAPDGSWIAVGQGDYRSGSVQIRDAVTGGRIGQFDLGDKLRAIAIAPDGRWLAAGGGHVVRIWDVDTKQEMATLDRLDSVSAVAIASDGMWLAIGSGRTVRLWEPFTGGAPPQRDRTRHWQMSAVAISPDGSWVAGWRPSVTRAEPVHIWDTATGTERFSLPRKSDVVAIGLDGSWLATNGFPTFWDADTGRERSRPDELDTIWLVQGIGRTLHSVSEEGRLGLDDIQGLQQPIEISSSDEGTWFARRSKNNVARIWDGTGQRRATIFGHKDWVSVVAIAPDGNWIASAGTDYAVRIWDAGTGQKKATLTGHKDEVTAIAAAPDSSWLVTTSYDRTARIWDAASGEERATLIGHDGWVDVVAVAPGGDLLATGGKDHTLRIWDAATGQLETLMRFENPIEACAWSNNNVIAIAGEAGLYLFDFLPRPR